MFDVLVDAQIDDHRAWAKKGDFRAMVNLAGHLADGNKTRRNEKLALEIIDHVLGRRAEIPSKDILLNALDWKARLVEKDEEAQPVFVEYIREMTQWPAEKWELERLAFAIEWLESHPFGSESAD